MLWSGCDEQQTRTNLNPIARHSADVEHFQRLEQLIWASPAEDVVPTHIAITAIHNGGGLLGAFADDGPAETGGMVGLTFWFPGLGVPTTGEGRGAGEPLTGEGRHKG